MECPDIILDRIAAATRSADCTISAHVRDIDTGLETGINDERLVVTASVFKVPVLTEYVRRVVAGDFDPAQRIVIPPGSAAPGGTGLSVFVDAADWSLRDVATSMITVSDNGATDIVMGLVGVDRVNATMAALGLPNTVLTGDCRSLFDSMAAELGVGLEDLDDAMARADEDDIARLSVCTPQATSRSTAAESTRLLSLLWMDQAASPSACAEARRILRLQVWPHRLASGFPQPDVRVAGKTGTIGVVRNEVGVVEFPDGGRFAVAVFVRSRSSAARQPVTDALIGTVGAALVSALRVQLGMASDFSPSL